MSFLFRSTKVGPFEISFYDKLFIGLFGVLFVVGLWFGRSGWGARHYGGGVAWAAAYNQTQDLSAYQPNVAAVYGPGIPLSTAITITQSTVASYEAQQHNAPNKYVNVRVLKNYTWNQFGQLMIGQFSGALGVSCQYCHLGVNYASDYNATKRVARQMILMTRAINSTIFWAGSHQPLVSCQTCHMGNAKPNRVENDPTTASYPLDPSSIALSNVWSGGPDYLKGSLAPTQGTWQSVITGITAQQLKYSDSGLQGSVTGGRLLLRTMAKMSTSLGVGCTYCHNSRNFGSYEVLPKTYSLSMMYSTQGVDTNYLQRIAVNGQGLYLASCYMCHRAYTIAPGAVPYNSLYAFKGYFPAAGVPFGHWYDGKDYYDGQKYVGVNRPDGALNHPK